MLNDNIFKKPEIHSKIEAKSAEIGFTMPSDLNIGSLLKTLIASKPSGNFLELGTGIGLSLSWMIDGMDDNSTLTSVDNDPKLIQIAKEFFGDNERVKLILADGANWIENYQGSQFDLIFGNLPWNVINNIHQPKLRDEIGEIGKNYDIFMSWKNKSNSELATVLICIIQEYLLKKAGIFAFLLPGSIVPFGASAPQKEQ